MRVEELMNRHVRVCGPNDSLSHAAQIMWDGDCGCVPVVDGNGRPVAMITDRDVCMAAYTGGRSLSELSVWGASAHHPCTVRLDDEIATAEQRMRQFQVRRVPVVDAQGKLVGILSMNDLARQARLRGARGPSAEGVVKTLAAICSRPAGATGAH